MTRIDVTAPCTEGRQAAPRGGGRGQSALVFALRSTVCPPAGSRETPAGPGNSGPGTGILKSRPGSRGNPGRVRPGSGRESRGFSVSGRLDRGHLRPMAFSPSFRFRPADPEPHPLLPHQLYPLLMGPSDDDSNDDGSIAKMATTVKAHLEQKLSQMEVSCINTGFGVTTSVTQIRAGVSRECAAHSSSASSWLLNSTVLGRRRGRRGST